LRVGYLNKINAHSFSDFLKIKGFNKRDAFEVDAVIISENLSLWSVRLDRLCCTKLFLRASSAI
ncbi:hypothetical protein ABLU14_19535, partial [Acinetobacter nosocomialis]